MDNQKSKIENKLKTLSILELNGLGSEIWEKIDIDYYVHQERQWE